MKKWKREAQKVKATLGFGGEEIKEERVNI